MFIGQYLVVLCVTQEMELLKDTSQMYSKVFILEEPHDSFRKLTEAEREHLVALGDGVGCKEKLMMHQKKLHVMLASI